MDALKPSPTTQEVLSPEDLAAADARELSYLLSSKAYQNFYEPLLTGIMQGWLAQLADPSLTRKWNKPDDYLRGGIAVARAILNAPHEVIRAQTQRNAEEVPEAERQAHYDRIARNGRGFIEEHQAGVSPTDPI